jgi:hypothetical protein
MGIEKEQVYQTLLEICLLILIYFIKLNVMIMFEYLLSKVFYPFFKNYMQNLSLLSLKYK